MGWTQIIGYILSIGWEIFKLVMADREKAAAEQKAWEIDIEKLHNFGQAAIIKLRQQAKEDSEKAGSAWDEADQDQGKK